MEFFHVISYRLWNSNYFSFGNPVPLKITKPYIRLILKFVNGIIFPVFRVLRKFETFTIRDDVPRTLSRFLITSETRGEEGKDYRGREGIKVSRKGSKGQRQGKQDPMSRDGYGVYILGRNFSRAEREPRRFNKLAEVATKIRALFSREWIVTGRFNLWLPTFLVPLPRCRRLRGEKEEGGERERRGSERRIKVITGHSFLSRRGFSLVSKRSLSPEIGRIFFNFHAWISHTLFDIPF